MNSGHNGSAAISQLERHLAPPAAPMAMPEQIIERKRGVAGLLALFALPFLAAR